MDEAKVGHESLFVKLLESPKTSKLVYKKLKHIQNEHAKKTQETGLKDIGLFFETNRTTVSKNSPDVKFPCLFLKSPRVSTTSHRLSNACPPAELR